MKKFISVIILFLISICAFASDWKEIQSVEVPQGTPIYYNTNHDTGKTKYCIYINGIGVNVSETNAKAFVAGMRRLELVKWYNVKTDSYKYTIRQLKLQNIDFNNINYDSKNKTYDNSSYH